MKTKPEKISTRFLLFVIPLTLALLSVACISGITLGDSNSMEVSVTLDENDINSILDLSIDYSDDEDNLLTNITNVDFQDGFIRVFGTHERDENTSVTGSLDFSVTVKNGMLDVEVTGVDIPGLDINDERITRFNQRLGTELSKAATDSDAAEFTEVTITEDAIEITIRITPDQ
jgi:hypothetical protein